MQTSIPGRRDSSAKAALGATSSVAPRTLPASQSFTNAILGNVATDRNSASVNLFLLRASVQDIRILVSALSLVSSLTRAKVSLQEGKRSKP